MEKLNLIKAEYSAIYTAKSEPSLLDVPALSAFAVDGEGDPNGSALFEAATAALYSCAYGIKMGMKKAGAADWGVMPLEGEWWADDMASFSVDDKSGWKWTLFIVQPPFITGAEALEAIATAKGKKKFSADVRFERRPAYKAAHILHAGPFSAEGPTIARLHAFIESSGLRLCGRHREIYLSDSRKTAPERLKTIIMQGVSGK